jgi:hypothetical protein
MGSDRTGELRHGPARRPPAKAGAGGSNSGETLHGVSAGSFARPAAGRHRDLLQGRAHRAPARPCSASSGEAMHVPSAMSSGRPRRGNLYQGAASSSQASAHELGHAGARDLEAAARPSSGMQAQTSFQRCLRPWRRSARGGASQPRMGEGRRRGDEAARRSQLRPCVPTLSL